MRMRILIGTHVLYTGCLSFHSTTARLETAWSWQEPIGADRRGALTSKVGKQGPTVMSAASLSATAAVRQGRLFLESRV